MNNTFKAIITRKDLYSKHYNVVKRSGGFQNSIKSGVVEIMIKIIKELN